MAESVGTIYYTVEADTQKLLDSVGPTDASLNRLNQQFGRTDKAAKQTEFQMTKTAKAVQGLGRSSTSLSALDVAFIGLAASAAGAALALGKIALSTVKSIDEVSNFASQIGTTTEALTGLRFASQQFANVSDQQFNMALRRMTRRIAEAAEGGGAASKTFKDLNVDVKALARMSPDQQFLAFADAIKRTDDQGKRLQYTMSLFDTEGMPLVNALMQGSEELERNIELAQRFGVVLDTETAQAAENLTMSLNQLRAIKDGLATEVASRLIPTFAGWADSMVDATSGAVNMERIVDGAFNAITVASVAAAAGLSRYTASVALAGAQSVIKASRAQLAAVAELRAARAQEQQTRATLAQITAMQGLGATRAQLTAATNAQAAAEARLAAAQSAAGVAARGLLGVLGGPAGIAITAGIAAAAMLGFSRNTKEASTAAESANKSVDELAKSFSRLTAAELRQEIRNQTAELEEQEKQLAALEDNAEGLREEIKRMGEGTQVYREFQDAIINVEADIERQRRVVKGLNNEYQALVRTLREVEAAASGEQAPQAGVDPSKEENKYLATLRQQRELAELTGRARAELAAIQRLGADATREEREEAERLAGEIYDLEEARRKLGSSSKAEIDNTKQNVEAIKRLEEELHLATLQGLELAEARALQALNEFATPDEIERVRELASAIHEVSEAERLRSELRRVDPFEDERARHQEELNRLRELNEAKLLEDQRYLDLKLEAELEHAERMAEIKEEEFRKQSEWNEILMSSLDELETATTNAITGLLTGASTGTQALQALGQAIMKDVVASYVRMGVEHVKAIVMGRTAQSAAGAAYAAATAAQVKATTALAGQAAYASTAAIPIVGPKLAPAAAKVALGAAGSLGAPAITSSALAARRQHGGPVAAGRMYRINEGGQPEILNTADGRQWLLPNQRGEVVSNREAQTDAQVPVVIELSLHGSWFNTNDVRRLIEDINEAVEGGAVIQLS